MRFIPDPVSSRDSGRRTLRVRFGAHTVDLWWLPI